MLDIRVFFLVADVICIKEAVANVFFGSKNRNRTDAYLKTENFPTWEINRRMKKFKWKVTEHISFD